MGSSISYYLKSSSMQDLHDYASDLNNNDFNELNIFNNNIIDAKCNNDVKYYELFIYLHSELDDSIKTMYINNANKHNLLVDSYLNFIKNYDSSIDGADYCLNAGFDLICPNNINCEFGQLVCADHKVVCCMKFKNKYVSYYLYSRSSTPIKTPLRLANNVGIIDSGYRGNIKALFDCIYDKKFYNSNKESFELESKKSYIQICSPNIEYPMKVIIVDDLNMLGKNTSRGVGGFGSTDK
jgi:dUTP pyrophosphatase